MSANRQWFAAAVALLVIACVFSVSRARFFEPIEGVDPPEDVTGVDCAMCHGEKHKSVKFPHEPVSAGSCEICHQTTGVGGHGELVAKDRTLCMACHTDKAHHYTPANCWSAGCHSDVHGSDVDELYIASRHEDYPGFTEATCDAGFVGTQVCLSCHKDYCNEWAESIHSLTDVGSRVVDERGCEACHGAGGNHWGRPAGIGIFRYATQEEVDDTCLVCHKSETYVPDYKSNTHTRSGMSCTACHNPHNLAHKHNLRDDPNGLCLTCHKTERLDFAKISHHPVDLEDPRSGMLCVDCHDPHGGEERHMLELPKDDFCFKCHVDKQGPFIFQHAGYEPGMGQGCATCHDAHGASNPNLLKMTGRGVCLQCHTDRVAHFPAQTCWTTGCHSSHHGSNESFMFFEP